MSVTKEEVTSYVIIAFLLLGTLFGMQIMSFIFGTLSPSSVASFTDSTVTVINETDGFINETGYILTNASRFGFDGGISITQASNATDNSTISASEFTLNSATGLLINATAVEYDDVTFSYTYLLKSQSQLTSEAIQNDSLGAIQTYTSGSSTQFSTLNIAITLILLIGLFIIFWSLVMKGGVLSMGSDKDKSSGNFS